MNKVAGVLFSLAILAVVGCGGEDAAPQPPSVTTQPASAAVVGGQDATFTVVATSSGLSYQWQRSIDSGTTWTDVTGATSAGYTFTTILTDTDAQFACVVANIGGSVTSDAATLTVTMASPTITTQPADATFVEGRDATFTVAVIGGALSYQWQRSDDNGATWADVTGATSAGYTFSTILADTGAQFACAVTNTLGNVTSNAATLTVQPFVSWKVDTGVAASGDGMFWTVAFKTLQEALDVATAGEEIWVAAGTYYPTTRSGSARTETFQLLDGVAIYGGFDGAETLRSQRDWATNVTTLSGDIGVPGNDSDNAYHVVTGADNATLDGVTVTAGNADGFYPHNHGGGMYNKNFSPTVTNCVFAENWADIGGGGMSNGGSSPTLTNCTFSDNATGWYGGGVSNATASPTLTNCTFSGNTTVEDGGGMSNARSSPTVTNCVFSENSAGYDGGGMFNDEESSPTVTNCMFFGNSAGYDGGGMHNGQLSFPASSSSPTVTNCTFSGNSAGADGGGMYNDYTSSPTLTNCVFSGNSGGDEGGGIYNYMSSPMLTNCILWGNTAAISGPEVHNYVSTSTFSHCDIDGSGGSVSWDTSIGTDGGNNIDDDPLFIDPDGADNIVGTDDDNLRLAGSSPCIDAGDTTALPADTADLDGDSDITEDIPHDLDGNPRVVGSEVDMGAYEVQ